MDGRSTTLGSNCSLVRFLRADLGDSGKVIGGSSAVRTRVGFFTGPYGS